MTQFAQAIAACRCRLAKTPQIRLIAIGQRDPELPIIRVSNIPFRYALGSLGKLNKLAED